MMTLQPVPVLDLWFKEATSIFQAENKTFRVCHATLASISPIFGHMLELPQPLNADRMEGCVLIHLPDSATDITYFFRAIFDPTSFASPPAQTSYAAIIAILRLSHKYDVQNLRQIALQHLATAYPTTLHAWDARSTTRTFPATFKFDDELELLHVAANVDVQWILPTLFYSCCSHTMNEILGSAKWINAGRIAEKQSCLLGYSKQYAATARIFRFLALPIVEGCRSPEKCNASALHWFDIVETWRASIPLDVWDVGDWKEFGKGVCSACLAHCRKSHLKARQVIWNELPHMYGLQRWEELERLKVAAIGLK